MNAYLWVSLGAVVGAAARYAISRFGANIISPDFPYGTLFINATGSFLLGLFLIWTSERVPGRSTLAAAHRHRLLRLLYDFFQLCL